MSQKFCIREILSLSTDADSVTNTIFCVVQHVFKASALWADAFYKSKCPSVCLSVCVSVCSLLRYRLTVFLPPLPEVGCPIFLEIPNPLGKVVERSGLRCDLIWFENCQKLPRKKKFFFADFALVHPSMASVL